MELTTTVTLDEKLKPALAAILDCKLSQLDARLNKVAEAAVKEYLDMFQGTAVFRRGSDLLENRLLLLIEHALDGKIPDESTVSRLFQTTQTESRSLIRAVISKYQYRLKVQLDETVVATLSSAKPDNDSSVYTVAISSVSVVNALNLTLATLDAGLKPVSKQRNSVSNYQISASAFSRLCTQYGVKPSEKPGA